MAKINKEEYEILKSLDDKWEWIARDDLFNDVCTHSLKPIKEENEWINRNYEYDSLDDRYFQFIQWENKEPYNIQELIDEYESEETEVKKDKEWLLDTFRSRQAFNNNFSKGYVLEKVKQLDETETLSHEWIDKNSELGNFITNEGLNFDRFVKADKLENLLVPNQEEITESFIETVRELIETSELAMDVRKLTGMTLEEIKEEARNGGFVPKHPTVEVQELINKYSIDTMSTYDVKVEREKFVKDLQSLIVPKQELPEIPQFVAEWYESEGKCSDWWNWFYKWGRDESMTELETKTIKWMQDYNEEKFVDIFKYGYEVDEREPKYVIKLDDESYLQRYEIDNKNIVTPFRIVGHLKEVAIKFDNKKKAEKVAELVEGKVEKVD